MMDAPLSMRREVGVGGPAISVLRLVQTALDGTAESFVNIFDNISERLCKRQEPFAEPLHGVVAIVTGGNAGIGFATAQQLARRGAHVVLACRDKRRADAAVQAIARTPPLPGCAPLPALGASVVSASSLSGSAATAPAAPLIRVESMELDLSRLSSVRGFTEQWRSRGLPLHLLVCNAGVMGPLQRLETPDGVELQFQVNFLSHWLLANQLVGIERERRLTVAAAAASPARATSTEKLLVNGGSAAAADAATAFASPVARLWASRSELLGRNTVAEAGSPASQEAPLCNGSTRVVMVTSLMHRAGPLQWHDKQSCGSYEPFLSYGLSKLANILTAKELQRRFDRSQAYGQDTAVAVHPGLVSTDLANGFFAHRITGWAAATPLEPVVGAAVGAFSQAVGPLLMRTPEQSAAVMLHACLAPSAGVAGSYLALGRKAQPDQAAEDPSLAAELWRYAEQLTGYMAHPSLRLRNETETSTPTPRHQQETQ